MDPKKWETMSESKRNAMMDECFAYDDVLRKKGHFVGGEALQSAENDTTLRWENGKVSITDEPYAETKEQFGWDPRVRGQRPEPRHPVDVKTPGCEGRALRDSPG